MSRLNASAVTRLRASGDEAGVHRRTIRAVGRASAALDRPRDVDELLRRLAAELCALVDAPRCIVSLRDDETGLYRGRVGHGAEDRLVQRLTCGLLADRFTREVVETKATVVLQDAMHDPRAIVSTMRAWGVSRVMGVPMIHGDEVIGIFFVDSRDRVRVFTADDEDLASAFAELAAPTIARELEIAELHTRVQAVGSKNAIMRQAAAVEARLTGLVLDGGGLSELVAALAEMTSHLCVIYDAQHEPLAVGDPDGVDRPQQPPDLAAALAGRELAPDRPTAIEPVREAGLPRRMLATAVVVRGERRATLALVERSRRLGGFDGLALRRAAGVVGLVLETARRAGATAPDPRPALAAALVDGGAEPADLEWLAVLAGMRLHAPHLACHLVPRPGAPAPGCAAVERALAGLAPELDVLVAGLSDGLAVLLEVPPGGTRDAMALVAEVSEQLDLSAGISSECTGIAAYAHAYEEARQCARCLTAFRSRRRVVSAEELGAVRVLLASCDPAEVGRFADDALAALGGSAELLNTLDRFLREAANVRRTAAALGVHENTIRYRLARVEELTGSAVGSDAEVQLRLRLALAVERLRSAR